MRNKKISGRYPACFCLIIAALLLSQLSVAQKITRDSLWSPFKNFTGSWTGTGEGEPGKGSYQRSFTFIFNGTFLEIKNRSVYPPSPANNNKEEVHEDIGYVSYDRSRKTFILRQFHKEGFVNQYKLDSISPDRKTLVFVTEAIENIPAGWQARETWQFTGATTFTETFELAEPGKAFSVYTKTMFDKAVK